MQSVLGSRLAKYWCHWNQFLGWFFGCGNVKNWFDIKHWLRTSPRTGLVEKGYLTSAHVYTLFSRGSVSEVTMRLNVILYFLMLCWPTFVIFILFWNAAQSLKQFFFSLAVPHSDRSNEQCSGCKYQYENWIKGFKVFLLPFMVIWRNENEACASVLISTVSTQF